jgi:hypothetical protein
MLLSELKWKPNAHRGELAIVQLDKEHKLYIHRYMKQEPIVFNLYVSHADTGRRREWVGQNAIEAQCLLYELTRENDDEARPRRRADQHV